MELSEHFTLSQFTRSATAEKAGISNEPTSEHLGSLRLLCVALLEPVRSLFGEIRITSGYRSPALNALTGGSASSQHCRGQAVDFVVDGKTPEEVCRAIITAKIDFDQMIEEFGQWTHISYSSVLNRGQVLRARRVNGRAQYSAFV